MVSKSDGMVRQTCSQVASVCSRFNVRAVRPRSDWHHTDTAIHHRWADGSLPIKKHCADRKHEQIRSRPLSLEWSTSAQCAVAVFGSRPPSENRKVLCLHTLHMMPTCVFVLSIPLRPIKWTGFLLRLAPALISRASLRCLQSLIETSSSSSWYRSWTYSLFLVPLNLVHHKSKRRKPLARIKMSGGNLDSD